MNLLILATILLAIMKTIEVVSSFFTKKQDTITNNIQHNVSNVQENHNIYTQVQIRELQQTIMSLQNQLSDQQVHFEINKPTHIPTHIEQALDVYARRNIHVPIEVIESVTYSGIDTVDNAISFIETERKNMIKDLGKRL